MNVYRCLAALTPFLMPATLHAQTWDGGDVDDNNWTSGDNWAGNVAPLNDGTAAVAFAGGVRLTPNLDANRSIASITFNSGAGAFTIGSTGGFALTTGAGGITNNSSNLQVISNPITLGAPQTWTTNTSFPIFATGAVNNGGNLLTFTGLRELDITGGLSGAGGLKVAMTSGFGARFTGAAANTFTGTTTVSAGLLELTKTAGVDAIARDLVIGDGIGGANADQVILFASDQINDATTTNTITINSSGRLNLNSNNETVRFLTLNGGNVITGTGTLTFTGVSNNLAVTASTASASISGNLNLGGSTRFFDVADSAGIANDLDVTAIISNGGITKTGAGTLRLASANTFTSTLLLTAGGLIVANNTATGTGQLTVDGGTLQAEGARALTNALQLSSDFIIAGGASDSFAFSGATTITNSNRTITTNATNNTTISGAIGQSGTRALTKAGAGNLIFSGAAANTYTGVTTVTAGILALNKTAGVNAIAGDIVIGDNVGGTDNLELDASNQIANTSNVTVNPSGVLNMNAATVTETIGSLTTTGPAANAFLGASTLTVAGTTTMTSGGVTSTTGGFVLGGNVTTNASASSAVISGNLNLGASTRQFTVAEGAAASDLDITAVVSNGGILKIGTGLLRLAGTNTYASGLNISGGTVVAASDAAAGTGTLTLTSGTFQAEGTRVLSNAVTLAVDFNVAGADSLTLNGSIGQSGGARALTKAGAGTLILGGTTSNSFTGLTTINEGTLALAKTTAGNQTAIAGSVVIGDGTGVDTLRYDQQFQLAFSSSVVTVNSSGVFNLNSFGDTISSLNVNGGSVVNLGLLRVTNGALMTGGIISGGSFHLIGGLTTSAAGSSAAIGASLDLEAATRTLTVDDGATGNDLDISGVVSNGGITKLGTGLLLLSGANTFAGGLAVNDGTVAFGSNTAAGTGALTLGTATVTTDGLSRQLGNSLVLNGNPTIAGLITFTGPSLLLTTPTINLAAAVTILNGVISEDIAGRGLTKSGVGNLRMGGANTYTGTTTVNQGSIELQGSGVVIPGNLVIGDGVGTDTVSYSSIGTDEQIANTSAVTINSSGTLILDAHLETIGSLLLGGGDVTATTGTLMLGGDVTSTASPSEALISANLGLGGSTRIFTVAEGGAVNDLDISGIISNGGITKTGTGLLRLGGSAANTYISTTTVNDGTLLLAKSVASGGIAGPLVIGDSAGTDIVRLAAADQIANTSTLTFNSAGQFDLNGFNESVFGLTMTGGSITSGNGTLTIGSNVTTNAHTAAATITGNLNLGGTLRTFTVADGTATPDLDVTATVTNGGVSKAGAGTLNISGSFANGVTLNAGTLSGTITVPAGATYTQNAGIFAGSLTVQGTFAFNGGSFAGTLNSQGTSTLNASLTVSGGLENSSTLTVGSGVTLTANGTGFTNLGTTTLSNGTIAGASATNDFGGQLNARGTIAAPFTNNGTLDVTGLLTLSAASSNAGSISVATTESLRVNGTFSNSGVITLSGGSISGTGTVTNTAGGTIEGRGAVSAPMASNAGFIHATGLLTLSSLTDHAASGELVVDPGVSLNISTPFTSAGFISLRGTDARLASGALTNNGLIDGTGRITSPIINNGVIRAAPGILTLGGPVTNNPGSRLEIGDDAEVLATGGLTANAGLINLAGGRFENVIAALNNTGLINGYGTLATGGLTNNGTVTLTGGNSTVHGNVTNAASKFFRVTGDTVLFTGNFTNNGTFKNTSSAVVFAGTYTENGVFISDPASNWFFDLVVSPTGYLIGGEGDVFIIGQDFLNGSEAAADWDTSAAALEFSGAAEHTVAVAGIDFGPVAAGYAANFAWTSVTLGAGEALTLSDGNATPGGALYTRTLLLKGGLPQIAAVTGDGHNIYYSPGEPANAYLAGGTYPLTGGGSIIPVQTVLEILNSTILPAGEVQLSVLGVPGGLHRVEASADLVTWTVIGNAAAAPDGTFTFTDNGAPAAVRRFYRVSFP